MFASVFSGNLFNQPGGSDEVHYDKGNNMYFLAHVQLHVERENRDRRFHSQASFINRLLQFFDVSVMRSGLSHIVRVRYESGTQAFADRIDAVDYNPGKAGPLI